MKYYYFYFILFFNASLIAYVNHHNNFDAILTYVNNDDHHAHTIVLLDIDNTIAQPRGTYVASDQWVGYLLKQKMNT